MEHVPDKFARYGRVVNWAKARYTVKGVCVTCVGVSIAGRPFFAGMHQPAVPSRFTLIEDLAAARYLGCPRHYPGETLATAYNPPLPR